jgi:hypothetical protein
LFDWLSLKIPNLEKGGKFEIFLLVHKYFFLTNLLRTLYYLMWRSSPSERYEFIDGSFESRRNVRYDEREARSREVRRV